MTEPRRPLFRQEVLAFQRHHRQWGDVAALQPLSTKILAWLLIGSVATILAFLCLAQYARKETAVGFLTPTKGTSKIFPPQRGTIKEVHVEEGSTVREGEALL